MFHTLFDVNGMSKALRVVVDPLVPPSGKVCARERSDTGVLLAAPLKSVPLFIGPSHIMMTDGDTAEIDTPTSLHIARTSEPPPPFQFATAVVPPAESQALKPA